MQASKTRSRGARLALGSRVSTWLVALAWVVPAWSGPFAPAAGQPGSTAISRDSAAIRSWAMDWQDYLPGMNVDPQWQTPAQTLGAADATALQPERIASLGANGQITLRFNPPIANGPGDDFAVFENGFSDNFLELARVAVSSDGDNFVTFLAVSFQPCPVGAFDPNGIDPTNITGFASKYRATFGTPFDLEDLAQLPEGQVLDLNAITHVRIEDVVGNGSAFDDWSRISAEFGPPLPNNPVCDPFPTSGSAGFDLDAVAVLNEGQFIPPPPLPTPVPLPWQALIFFAGVLTVLASRFIYPSNP